MELTFHDQIEFESFARVYMAGVAMRDKTGPTLAVTPTVGYARHVHAVRELEAMAPFVSGNGDHDPQPEAEAPVEGDGIVHEHIDLPPADETEQEVEKPKRKRRTKAEIEAEAQRIADEAPPEAGEMPEGYVAQLEAADVKVIEAEADELPAVMEHVPAEGQEKLPDVPKDAPKHQASAESLEKHAAAQAEYTPELIETLEGQAELFDANRTAHLNEGREAIAKHGFIKYMATFKGLGLDSAIATYNDDQVKLHRAAIAHLMAA